jgi:hypothetical protein
MDLFARSMLASLAGAVKRLENNNAGIKKFKVYHAITGKKKFWEELIAYFP